MVPVSYTHLDVYKRQVLKLELKQIKNKTIQWNYDYQDRLIIKSLFPLFVIDTRNIDILHWEYIWDIIGDFNKLSNHENNKISKETVSYTHLH